MINKINLGIYFNDNDKQFQLIRIINKIIYNNIIIIIIIFI